MPRLRSCLSPLLLAALLSPLPAAAASTGHGHGGHGGQHSPYAGQEAREIKSLSPADIEELRRGGGWGLAKAAELNGLPGPAHLLELKDDIPLSPDQVAAITGLHAEMNRKARAQGAVLIDLERRLEDRFRARDIGEGELAALLGEIGQARSALRHIHLATHLKTPAMLRPEQIARYNALRGYTVSATEGSDPCARVPEGHDPAMWRRHNGCQ